MAAKDLTGVWGRAKFQSWVSNFTPRSRSHTVKEAGVLSSEPTAQI